MVKKKASLRHWREIAEEMRKEQDAKRRDELVYELDKSLRRRGAKSQDRVDRLVCDFAGRSRYYQEKMKPWR
jgi:hypothetical protein